MAENARLDWLEDELYALGREIPYPPVPAIAGSVRTRLARQQLRPRRPLPALPRVTFRMAAAALLALLSILAATLGLVPSTREALAEFFGLQHIRVIRVGEMPAPAASPALSQDEGPALPVQPPTPGPRLAGAATLEEARQLAGFPILLPDYPAGIGAPDEVYVQELFAPSDVQVVLVYRPEPGMPQHAPEGDGKALFRLYQFRTSGAFLKFAGGGTELRELNIKCARAFWLEGAYHVLRYRDASGHERLESERVVEANTLAWEVGDMTYRLETSLPLEEAIKIAESLR